MEKLGLLESAEVDEIIEETKEYSTRSIKASSVAGALAWTICALTPSAASGFFW